MYRVTKDFKDGLTLEFHKTDDIIDVAPERVIALGDYIKPVKREIEPETEMINQDWEKAILPKPKNKGIKIIS